MGMLDSHHRAGSSSGNGRQSDNDNNKGSNRQTLWRTKNTLCAVLPTLLVLPLSSQWPWIVGFVVILI